MERRTRRGWGGGRDWYLRERGAEWMVVETESRMRRRKGSGCMALVERWWGRLNWSRIGKYR